PGARPTAPRGQSARVWRCRSCAMSTPSPRAMPMRATPTTSASDLPVRASSPLAAGGVRTSPSTTTVLEVELVVLTAGEMLVLVDVVVGLSVVGVVGLTDGVVVLVEVVVRVVGGGGVWLAGWAAVTDGVVVGA